MNEQMSVWFKILVFLTIVFVLNKVFSVYTKDPSLKNREGFEQEKNYIIKQDNEIYDDFYAEIYDDLNSSKERTTNELKKVIELTEPDKNSHFLDVGSGTGHFLNSLDQMGISAEGIDISKEMVDHSKTKFPDISNKCGDATVGFHYKNGNFTHVTCLYFTIYHLKDKHSFFKNCYYWLKRNGYLLVHMVDKNRFNTITPVANPVFFENPQIYSKKRIEKTEINFIDFSYKKKYDFGKNNVEVISKEQFKDYSTGNIRENELTLYMDTIDDIVKIAQMYGFIAKGYTKLDNDQYQYIFIFERQ